MTARADDTLLTASEIERISGVSRKTIKRLIEAGELTPVRVGARLRIPRAEWSAYLSGRGRRVGTS